MILRIILFLLLTVNVWAGTVDMPQYGPTDTLTNVNLNNRWNLLTNQINGGLDNTNSDVDNGFRFIEILSSDPAPGNAGRVIFNTTDNTLKFDTGTEFVEVGVLQNTQTWTGNNTFTGNTSSTGVNTYTGTDTFDDLTAATVDINGGTIDGTNIGDTSQSPAHVSTLKVGTTNQGDVLYDNGTSIVRLTPGTANQFLQTQGAGSNPQWLGVGWQFIARNNLDGVTTSTITHTFTDGAVYKLVLNWDNNGTNTWGIRFDGNSSAVYDFGVFGNKTADFSSLILLFGATANATSFLFNDGTDDACVANSEHCSAEFNIRRDGNTIYMQGSLVGFDGITSGTEMRYGGVFPDSDAADSVTFFQVGGAGSGVSEGEMYLFRASTE